jgi:hypothetical protein
MSLTYKWSVTRLQVIPQQDGKSNIVVSVDWRVTADDEANKLSASASGIKQLSLGNTFTDFNGLTEQQVLAWCFEPETNEVKDFEGKVVETITRHLKNEGETQVTGQLERQLAQKAAEPALPWAQIPA